MQRIAITGGVADGKTTVLRIFESLGAQTVSSDQLVAALLAPGTEVWEQLIREFGQAIIAADGALVRERLAALAFGDPVARRRLNQIMHPAVVRALQAQLRAHEPSLTPIFVEVPLLIEVALQGSFDAVVVVQATPRTAAPASHSAWCPTPACAANPASTTAHPMQDGLRRLGDSHPPLVGTSRSAGASHLAHAHAAGILGSATESDIGRQNRTGVSRVIRNLTEEEVRTQ
jgi:dephospho-CoA kinase